MRRKKQLWLVVAVLACGLLAALALRVIKSRRGHLNLPFVAVDAGPRVRTPLEPAELMYAGKLTSAWEDWGWGPHELGKGPARVKFAGFGGILFRHSALTGPYQGLSFRFKAPAGFGEFLQVSLRATGKPDDAFPVVWVSGRHIAAVDDGFSEVLVDWRELNPDGETFDRVLIGSRSQVADQWVLLDQVMLTKLINATSSSGDQQLSVRCDAGSHPISDLIYGNAGSDWSSGQSAMRIGGNPLTRANWELAVWNAGNDWFFENMKQKASQFQLVNLNRQQRHRLAVVVPMIGWVSKDETSVGFPRGKFAGQRKYDPNRPEAGDGARPDGSLIPPGDPSETSIAAPPELIGQWIRRVVEDDKREGARGIHMYILDNEPSLWNTTHRDVHPKPLGYDELLDRTIKYATAIREADPESVIAGPAEWGWTGYEFSAIDREEGRMRPDRRAHGNVQLVAWYLRKLAEYEKKTGKRLLDVFDLHFYPAANGLYGDNAGTDQPASELRLRQTRGLWDPSYDDESWIKDRVRLIPRMRDWVRENYPGRKLSIGEWSFGAETHISGGLATAEALGRFGQERLDAAFHWGELKEGTPGFWAFRAFRNFDGQGGRFQDLALPVHELEQVSLFASRDASGGKLVLVLVNRQPTTQQVADVRLLGCGKVTAARRFSYGADSKELTAGASEIKPSGVVATLEPYSITVLDLSVTPRP